VSQRKLPFRIPKRGRETLRFEVHADRHLPSPNVHWKAENSKIDALGLEVSRK
jgi:hypothetical protein